MDSETKLCACTGIRSCKLCDNTITISQSEQLNTKISQSKQLNNKNSQSEPCNNNIFWYCIQCQNIFQGDISTSINNTNNTPPCSLHNDRRSFDDSFNISGIHVYDNFITTQEESYLLSEINKKEWAPSQSGRRKQDFGPKVNFKRKKVKLGDFNGFPLYSDFLLDRLKAIDILSQFNAVELCNLEYMYERGSSIDPHIDDTWLWGEQLVTVNMLSDTILTLKKLVPKGKNDGDNNTHDKTNGGNIKEETIINKERDCGVNDEQYCGDNLPCNALLELQVLAPARSLLILDSDARYTWTHSIKRQHIGEKRVAMTFRNLSDEFGIGGEQHELGMKLIEIAQSFQTVVI